MPSDNQLSIAWMEFLEHVENARRELHCSQSAAWFRGHSNDRWPLQPSLFRYGTASDPEDKPEISRRERHVANERERWRDVVQRKAAARKALTSDQISTSYRAAYTEAAEEERAIKESIARAVDDLIRYSAPVNGEREVFDEFVFRAAKTEDVPSWVVLAEMRHHGVPTRLLDWTDRLDIAIYFALDAYRHTQERVSSFAVDVTALAKPCIWVLNPFRLSRRSTGRTAIWSLTRERDYDYYSRFLRERNWPFNEPMPIYPPANIERIQSQRGFFTLFGNTKDTLDAQLARGLNCIRKVEMSPEAARFGLDYLTRVQGLSPFEVYRDLDSLGRELAGRFRRIQTSTSRKV